MEEFRATTWNMGGGEPHGGPTDEASDRVLTEVKAMGASVILGQEVQEETNIRALHELGYKTFRALPESLVAWLPEVWTCVYKDVVRLNPDAPFHRKTSHPVYVNMAYVILCNDEGVSMDVGSYHTPSSVQEPNPAPERMAALRQSMETLGDLAEDSKCHATLFGGDDNVDEEGPMGEWGFMLRRSTGLRLVRAPRNTLGRRKVDDFRVRNLKPKNSGAIVHGPTDHNAYLQRFILPR
jgi:hypothetical protein